MCATADLAWSVPSCPPWSVADLLWHVTEVHHFWRTVLAEGLADATEYVQPTRPDGHELMAMYRVGAERLIDTLRATPDDTPVDVALRAWSEDHSARSVLRRMAHETAVHLIDAQQSVRRRPGSGDSATDPPVVEPSSVEAPAMDAELASDGIDELLHHFAADPGDLGPDQTTREQAPLGGTVHLHCTDVAGEWLVVDGADGSLDITREHAKGDCAIRGPAAQILMALWRRAPLDGLDVIGDGELAALFVARTRLE